MNKVVKGIIIAVIVVAVFVVALLVSGKEQVESIDNSDYEKISKNDGIVYYGSSDNIDDLKEIATEYGIRISFLDSKENENKDLKEGTLYIYDDGEEVYSYDDDLYSYKLVEALMKAGQIEKNYLEVNLDQYKEIMKEDGYHLMFIGRETCGYCTKFKTSIKEAMEDNDFMIYYIDTDKFTEDTDMSELTATDSYMSENEWGTPLSILYKDGKRVDVLNGYVDSSKLVEFLKKNKVI